MNSDDKVLSELINQLQGKQAVHQGMTIRNDEMFELTVRQLKAAIKTDPSHPHAAAFAQGVLGAGDDEKVVVCKVDLEALLTGKRVRIEHGIETSVLGGRMTTFAVETKYLED